jgi:phosphotransferase system enzyme I (PtsI)
MAGDPRYTRLLLGLGLNEFSMHPATLLAVKRIVRESSQKALASSAARTLKLLTTRNVHAMVEKLNSGLDAH